MKTLPLCLLLALTACFLTGNTLDMTGNPTATSVVAYSVRKLSSSYTGAAMQVRRSIDNDTFSIGFTAAGDLDTAKLLAFVNGGTGYVSIWYDQSGNGINAVQPKPAYQPTIVTGGVINRDNGLPSVYTTCASGYLYFLPGALLTSQVTKVEVCRNRNDTFEIIEGLGYFQLDLQLFPGYIWSQVQTGNITVGSSTVTTTRNLMSINSIRNSGGSQLYVNTLLQGTNTTTLSNLNTPDTGFIGRRFDYSSSSFAGPGAFSEIIYFSSVLSDADRQSMDYNENWYYSLGFDSCSFTKAVLSPNGTTEKALYACTQDTAYAYYYDPVHPLNLLFGIAKDPSHSGANASFLVDSINLTANANPDSVVYSSSSGQEGVFALGRYWNVYTHTQPTSPVNVRFFYNPVDTLTALKAAQVFQKSSGAAKLSSLQWFKTVGNPFSPDSLTSTPTAGVKGTTITLTPIYGAKNGVNYAEFDGVTSFSGGTAMYVASSSLIILPITLSSFTGRCVNNAVELDWLVQSGTNARLFDVEHSTDGSGWAQIGQVGATSNTSYSFTDVHPPIGSDNGYYRLKMVDGNGKSVYSGVVSISMCSVTSPVPELSIVAPNPFGSSMEISCVVPKSGSVEVKLEDITGHTLVRREFVATKGKNLFNLPNLSQLAKGTYIVLIIQERIIGVAKAVKD